MKNRLYGVMCDDNFIILKEKGKNKFQKRLCKINFNGEKSKFKSLNDLILFISKFLFINYIKIPTDIYATLIQNLKICI